MPRTNRLGDLERAVLEVLWADPDAWVTVRSVHEALAARRDLAYTTVMTVLDRMARKDLVEVRKDGRTNQYRPLRSRSAMTAELLRETLGEFAEDDRRAALVAFVGEASEADRAALREALAELERREG